MKKVNKIIVGVAGLTFLSSISGASASQGYSNNPSSNGANYKDSGGYLAMNTIVDTNAKPTATPFAKPTVTPNAKPTITYGAKPTVTPNAKPTITYGGKPTVTPNAKPTITYGAKPSVTPNAKPTAKASPKSSASTGGNIVSSFLAGFGKFFGGLFGK